MLNYIWAFMIAVGVLYGAFTGNIEAVSNAALDSAKEAVDLCITMIGVMGLWVGLMEIAQRSGLIAKMTKGIQPFISFMFPRLPKNHIAREYISTNIIANIMGLGWACTPAGLKAMEALQELNEKECAKNCAAAAGGERAGDDMRMPGVTRAAKKTAGASGKCKAGTVQITGCEGKAGFDPKVASNEMCTFLILNISSLQLIPVSMIAYRSQYGSASPTAIVGPAIVATFVSTLVGAAFAKVMDRGR